VAVLRAFSGSGGAIAVALSLGAWALVGGCGGFGPVQTCGEIPEGGCPLGRGGTCDDPYCAGLYDCVDGAWDLVEPCAGGGSTGTSSASTASGAGGGCLSFDHTNEADGCKPDLEPPDCPVVAAETCGDPCLTGCVDFYLCEASGWVDVAYCTDDGALIVTQAGAGG
jgi:hypothetical protein